VPGESSKRVVYDNVCLLAESYLRYGYDVVLSGLILTHEEQGALASRRAKQLCWAEPTGISIATRRSIWRCAGRQAETATSRRAGREVMAGRDVSLVPGPVRELEMRQPLAANVHQVIGVLSRASGDC